MSALRKKRLKSPSHSVTPLLDTPSGVGLGRHTFHEVMESGGLLVNQCLALSPSESGNKLNMSASSVTLLYLIVSQTSRKLVKCIFGFSLGNPWNRMF